MSSSFVHLHVHTEYCLAPETRVVTAAMEWKPIGDVEVGEELVGFDEDLRCSSESGGKSASKMRRTTVLASRRVMRDCYRITLEDGTSIVASAQHGWVANGTTRGSLVEPNGPAGGFGPNTRRWITTDNLVPGKSRLISWARPWEPLRPDQERDAAWLAGVLDGEGWLKEGQLSLGQNPGLVLDEVQRVCANLDYKITPLYRQSKKRECRYFYFQGYEVALRVLSQCRPVRLLPRLDEVWVGRRAGGRFSRPVLVTKLEHLGPRPTVALTTSTKTFVAEGFLSHNSSLDGAAKVADLANAAAEAGMPAIGMTDHGNMFGAYAFHTAAAKAGVKPVLGIEAYIAPASRHHKEPVFWGEPHQRKETSTGEGGDVSAGGAYLHMTMLAENATGLRNLFRLSSLASIEGTWKKPRMDVELIAEHADGIIATTGCPGGDVQTRLRLGQFDEALKAAGTWLDIFGRDHYFLELMDHGLPVERRVRDDLLEIGRRLGIRPLATNDSHYVRPQDADTHDTLLCIGIGKRKAEKDRFKFNGDGYYIKTPAEMRALFGSIPGACDNTLLIAERVQPYDEVFTPRDLLPRFTVPEGHTQESWLRHEVARGLTERYGDPVPERIRERAEFELGVIIEMGFPSYFLVVADICAFARAQGIAVGPGRGSAAGSMVAYALRITELDPLEHRLMFERFLNPDRVTLPDIDLDFDERRRGEVIDYVTRKYGSDRVAQILTISTIGAKAAVKDAARVLDKPYALSEQITKAFPQPLHGKDIPLAAVRDGSHPRHHEAAALRELADTNPDAREVIDTALALEGFIRQTGVHAAGVILSAEPLLGLVPLMRRDRDGAIICGFPYEEAEAMGLLKMDFLGLRNLTIVSDTLAAVQRRLGTTVDLLSAPLDDPATYALLARGDTLGVFQLDSVGLRNLLKMIKPTAFGDISAALALYRPGPMGANAHTDYARRKNGHQEITPIHPELAEPLADILSETYGLIVYQEQVMAIAQKVAGFSLAQADLLRRAMGKKKKAELDKQHAAFSSGMRERGFSDQAIEALWNILLPFSDYAFNRSHTAGYGLLSYWTAYLKANYTADYMAALLTSVSDDKKRLAAYLAECRRLGVIVLSPDVNESQEGFAAVGDDTIRFGLTAVHGVGAAAVAEIIKGRQGAPYASFSDFLDRIGPRACNKRVVESLIKAGAFDSLGHTRMGLSHVFEPMLTRATAASKAADLGFESLFAPGDDLPAPVIPDTEWDRDTLLAFEREMLGLYVSGHPLADAEQIIAANRSITIAEALVLEETTEITVCGMLVAVERNISKKGNPWANLHLEDLNASIEAKLFGSAYTLYIDALTEGALVAITGTLEMRDGGASFIARDIALVDRDQHAGLTLHLDEADVTAPFVKRLGEILHAYPGDTPVQINLARADGGRVRLALPNHPVTRSAALAADLKALAGPGALG